MQIQFCDGSGNCSGQLPGTRRVHQYLHDNMEWYRVWHHSVLRVPTHVAITVLLVSLATAGVLLPIQSQNPQAAVGISAQFPFQGRLTNADGTVVSDGSYDAVMQLYTQDTGGAPVWTENHTGADQITTLDGIFSTMLGSITSLAGIDFNQDEYWLGVTVGADAEMAPRIRLGAAPYAFNTDKLDGISGEAFLQLPGQAGGQTAYGGTAASQNLVLRSTSHATKGDIVVADDGGSLQVGSGTSTAKLQVDAGTQTGATDNDAAKLNVTWNSAGTAFNALEVNVTKTAALESDFGASSLLEMNVDGSTLYEFNSVGKFSISRAINPAGDSSIYTRTNGQNNSVFESSSTTESSYLTFYRTRGTITANSIVANGDILGNLHFGGHDGTGLTAGTGFRAGATIRAAVDGTPGTNDMPGRLEFLTTPDGSPLPAVRLTVSQSGNIVPGTGALATGASDGFLYLSSMAGVPTGTPTSFTGRVPLTYNTATNTLYAYNSGWQALNGGGGGITGSGAAGRVTVWSGTSAVTSDSDFLWDSTSNILSGVSNFNAPSAFPSWMSFSNNGGNLANVSFEGAISVYDSNDFASTVATAGTIRLPNAKTITAKAVGFGGTGGGNTNLIQLNSSDFIQLGPTSSAITALDNPVSGDAFFQFRNSGGGNQNIQVEGYLSVYNSNEFASTIATAGAIRLTNGSTITAKSVGSGGTGGGNTNLIALNGSDFIQLGPTSSGVVAFDNPVSGLSLFQFRNGPGATGGNANVSIEGALEVHDTNGFGTVATTGHIRLPNAAALTAKAVGSGGTGGGNTNLIRLNGSDFIQFGPTSTSTVTFDNPVSGLSLFQFRNGPLATGGNANVSIEGALEVHDTNGFGTVATAGHIRLPNNATIMARNAGGTADIGLIKLDTNDYIQLGQTSAGLVELEVGTANGQFRFRNGPGATSGNASVAIEGHLEVHSTNGFTTTASSGHIRLPNNAPLTARNAGNSADVDVIKLNASNNVQLGADTTVIGDYYDTTIPASVSSTTLCISGGGQIGTCTSDARLKTNIQDIDSGLDIIEQLSPKTFDFISGQTHQSGFLAQDVQKILPGAVAKNTGDDYLSLNYDGIVAYAVQAIQELDQQIKVLDASKAGKADRLSLTALTTRSLVVSSGARIDGSLAVAGSTEFAGTLLVKDTATFEKDVAVGGNLAVSGSILGSPQTRGIDVPVEQSATVLEVLGLELPEDSTYAVSVTPSWRTGFWVTDKTNESFTIHFDVPAPKDATADYLIQR